MKAFLAAMVAMAVIAVAAHFYLDNLGFTSASKYSTENTRLGG